MSVIFKSCIKTLRGMNSPNVELSKYYLSIRLRSNIVLGIETSCDDTGCAIVNDEGKVLGEALCSQTQIHLKMGGIIPLLARDLHKQNIDFVVNEALNSARLKISDVDAIAVTTKPGLKVALTVGKNYGKKLSEESGKPFIPVHHMQAHALTARMIQPVEFPFLVLLISGGHCLLAIAQSSVEFLLLGQSLNDAPGEALDKVARRLNLRLIPEFANCCGGEAIEKAARKGYPNISKTDCTSYIVVPLLQYRDCNFSFAGIKQRAHQHIARQEKKYDIAGGTTIPGAYDLCANVLHTMTLHLCQRVQRAMVFAEEKELIPKEKQTLVVSGGVACNSYIKQGLEIVTQQMGYKLVVPPPKLCTDNGVMIAWNGIEKLRLNQDVIPASKIQDIDVEGRCLIGEDIRKQVSDAHIKCKWIKLDELIKKTFTAPR